MNLRMGQAAWLKPKVEDVSEVPKNLMSELGSVSVELWFKIKIGLEWDMDIIKNHNNSYNE